MKRLDMIDALIIYAEREKELKLNELKAIETDIRHLVNEKAGLLEEEEIKIHGYLPPRTRSRHG